GIPEHVCDVPSHDNYPPLDVSKDQIEDFFESNKEFSSIDDDSFSIDDIDYVEASPPDFELVNSEVMEIVIPEVGGIDDDILLTIEHDDLHEKLRNVNLLISKIEALNVNPTPSSDCKTKSSSTKEFSSIDDDSFSIDDIDYVEASPPDFELVNSEVMEIVISENMKLSMTIILKSSVVAILLLILILIFMLRSSLIFRSIHFLLPIGVILMSSWMNSFPSYLLQSMIVSVSRLNQTRGISLW
nr:hypothetical protein [Tanacetum cinerariifolium]